MHKVILTGFIIIDAKDKALILQALETHIQLTRQEAGCIRFDVTPDMNDAKKYWVHEEFVDKVAFDFHQSRTKASSWGRISANVERHYQPLVTVSADSFFE